jgi:hypothetical protein
VAALGAAAVYPVIAADRLVALMAGLGGFSLVLLLAAVGLRSPGLVAWAVAVYGAEYAVFLGFHGATVDRSAPVVAAALLVATELGYRVTEPSDPAPERAVVVRSIGWLFAAMVGAAALGAMLLAAAGAAHAGLALEALGAAAAVLALGFLIALVARTRDST